MNLAQARTTLITTMLVTLISTAGIALPYPILAPLFMGDTHSALTQFMGFPPKFLFGVILALYPLGLLIGGSFIGALSDLYGRKRVLLISLLFAAMGYALTAYALIQENFLLFAFARLMTGLCEGNMAIARALAVDLHPTIDRTRALSLVMSTNYAGWLLGPLAGGYLYIYGAEMPFWLATGTIILCALLVILCIPKDEIDQDKAPGSVFRAIKDNNSLGLLSKPGIVPLMVFHFFMSLGLNAFYEFYPLWLVEVYQYTARDIAWLTVATTAAMITSSALLVTAVSRRSQPLILITVSTALLALSFVTLPRIDPALIIFVFPISGILIASINGVFPAFMSEKYGEFGQGRVMGLITTSFCLANVVISIVGSLIALFGSEWALYCGASLMFIASFIMFRHQGQAGEGVPDKVVPNQGG